MKAVLVFFTLCLAILAAPSHDELTSVFGGPRPAYYKDIEIPPTADTKIINGESASRRQFPFQASFEWTWAITPWHLCGGSIITARTVVTAAHCIRDFGVYRVVAGILDRGESTTDRQERSLSDIISHPGFPGGDVVAPFDIALLIVESAFTFTSAVSPIALPSSGSSFSGTAVLSGWGATSSSNSEPSISLQFAEKNLITESQCADALIGILGHSSVLDSTMVCTSGAYRVSACGGDSGSPLSQNGVLVGIVSWGISPCGTFNGPTVHTRTASFVDWILSNVV